eukprot:3565064-Pyramimonas_sp.AAC.2
MVVLRPAVLGCVKGFYFKGRFRGRAAHEELCAPLVARPSRPPGGAVLFDEGAGVHGAGEGGASEADGDVARELGPGGGVQHGNVARAKGNAVAVREGLGNQLQQPPHCVRE